MNGRRPIVRQKGLSQMPNNRSLVQVWTPEDYHEVAEQAATYHAGLSLPPVELGAAEVTP